jgi:hypothetical protein
MRMRTIRRRAKLGTFVLALALIGGGPRLAQAQAPLINEFVINHAGTDFNEYVEVRGAPNTDYFNLWVLALEGDLEANRGTVDAAVRLGTSDARGLVTTGYLTNRLENGTITLLLVRNFTGAESTDLDTDDNGTLDVTPWDELLDGVAVTDGHTGDRVYASVVLAPGFGGDAFPVGGASRIPDGAPTWVRNDFDGEGIPGFNGTLTPATEALNTPADPNRLTYASGGGAAPPGLRIHDIQGARHRSPFEGQPISAVDGVVSAIDLTPSFARGFYMQDPEPDDDPRTSEGIFVLTGATSPIGLGITVGARVQVSGIVEENRPAANVANLTVTRIRSNATPASQIAVVDPGPLAITPTSWGSADACRRRQ